MCRRRGRRIGDEGSDGGENSDGEGDENADGGVDPDGGADDQECPEVGTPTTETLAPRGTDDGRTSLESRISDRGHYTWFALGEGAWGRQRNPYDIRESCSRWMAEPTANGVIRFS